MAAWGESGCHHSPMALMAPLMLHVRAGAGSDAALHEPSSGHGPLQWHHCHGTMGGWCPVAARGRVAPGMQGWSHAQLPPACGCQGTALSSGSHGSPAVGGASHEPLAFPFLFFFIFFFFVCVLSLSLFLSLLHFLSIFLFLACSHSLPAFMLPSCALFTAHTHRASCLMLLISTHSPSAEVPPCPCAQSP